MGVEHAHPLSWRLFRAHPAIGLEETDGDWVWEPRAPELGVPWLALEPAEQRRRAEDFDHALRAAALSGDWQLELVRDGDLLRGVWMDRWKAPALQRELLDRVWEQAERRRGCTTVSPEIRRRREVDRMLRAHVLVTWDRYSGRILLGGLWLLGVIGLYPLGYGYVADLAVVLVSALIVMFVLDRLVTRWYRRGPWRKRR